MNGFVISRSPVRSRGWLQVVQCSQLAVTSVARALYRDQPSRYGGLSQKSASSSLVMDGRVESYSRVRAARAAIVPSNAISVMRLPKSKFHIGGRSRFTRLHPFFVMANGSLESLRRRLKISESFLWSSWFFPPYILRSLPFSPTNSKPSTGMSVLAGSSIGRGGLIPPSYQIICSAGIPCRSGNSHVTTFE